MKHILICLFLTLPGGAWALSCVFADIPFTYKELAASPDTYVIVYGEFHRNPTLLSQSRDLEVLRYRLSGKMIKPDGSTRSFDRPVTVNRSRPRPDLAAPGGRVFADRKVLAFVQVVDGGYVLNVSFCPFYLYYDPSQADLNQLASCIKGYACESESGF